MRCPFPPPAKSSTPATPPPSSRTAKPPSTRAALSPASRLKRPTRLDWPGQPGANGRWKTPITGDATPSGAKIAAACATKMPPVHWPCYARPCCDPCCTAVGEPPDRSSNEWPPAPVTASNCSPNALSSARTQKPWANGSVSFSVPTRTHALTPRYSIAAVGWETAKYPASAPWSVVSSQWSVVSLPPVRARRRSPGGAKG